MRLNVTPQQLQQNQRFNEERVAFEQQAHAGTDYSQIGESIGKLNAFIVKRQEEKDAVALLEMQNAYDERVADLLYNKETGLLYKQGDKGLELQAEYKEAEQKIREEIFQNSKLKFQKSVDYFNQSNNQDVVKKTTHLKGVERENEVNHNTAVFDNRLTQIADNDLLNDGNVDYGNTIDEIYKAVLVQANVLNLDEEQTQILLRKSFGMQYAKLQQKFVANNDLDGLETLNNNFEGFIDESLATSGKSALKEVKMNRFISDNFSYDYFVNGMAQGKTQEQIIQEITDNAINEAKKGKGLPNQAIDIIVSNEGDYGSINRNDEGLTSVGKFQWRGDRAQGLLQNIKDTSPEQYNAVMQKYGVGDLANNFNWTANILDQNQANAVSELLSTGAGVKAQQNLANKDVSEYINQGKKAGIDDPTALVLFADWVNNWGSGGRILPIAGQGFKSGGLQGMIDAVAPHLNDVQINRMNNVLAQTKNIKAGNEELTRSEEDAIKVKASQQVAQYAKQYEAEHKQAIMGIKERWGTFLFDNPDATPAQKRSYLSGLVGNDSRAKSAFGAEFGNLTTAIKQGANAEKANALHMEAMKRGIASGEINAGNINLVMSNSGVVFSDANTVTIQHLIDNQAQGDIYQAEIKKILKTEGTNDYVRDEVAKQIAGTLVLKEAELGRTLNINEIKEATDSHINEVVGIKKGFFFNEDITQMDAERYGLVTIIEVDDEFVHGRDKRGNLVSVKK